MPKIVAETRQFYTAYVSIGDPQLRLFTLKMPSEFAGKKRDP